MAKRYLPFPFGNPEHASNVTDELHESVPTVRLYEKLFGFVIERERRHPLSVTPGTVLKKRRRRTPDQALRGAQPASRPAPGRVAAFDARALQASRGQRPTGATAALPAAPATASSSSPRRGRRNPAPTAPVRKRKVKQ